MACEIAEWKHSVHPVTGDLYRWKLNFITLTLPADQGDMSDKDAKRFLLMPMLQDLKRKHNVFLYVWKAEAQENGNIHFHITTDKFIPHEDLRRRWNYILARWGFIEAYRSNMMAFHKNGFRLRRDKLDTWPIHAQRKAYREGMANNWSNPNTTDIHATFDVSDMAAYMTKYFTKNEPARRKIEGRLVGWSDNLSYKHKFTVYANQQDKESRTYFEQLPDDRKIQTDYCTVILLDRTDWLNIANTQLAIDWKLHCKRLRHYISPRDKIIKRSVSPRKKPRQRSCRIYTRTSINELRTTDSTRPGEMLTA